MVMAPVDRDVAPLGYDAARHRHEADRDAAGHFVLDGLRGDIAHGAIQPNAWQRGHQRERPESRRLRLRFAALEQRTADAAACLCRIHEECADPRRFPRRIERRGVALPVRIAAEQRAAAAPASATDQRAFALRYEVGAIEDQLSIQTECTGQRGLDLGGIVVAGAQRPRGPRDQCGDGRAVVESRDPQLERGRLR